VKVALTIAGSDSGGGAGIQADLRTFAAHGLHPTSAITAVTAQNSVTVTDWAPIEPRLVVAQIEAVAADMPVAAVKTGMLATADVVRAVAETLARLKLPHLVVDPVMVAKSGDRLLAPEAEGAYLEALLPLAEVVTPNLLEAEVLLGREVRTLEAMREAARELCAPAIPSTSSPTRAGSRSFPRSASTPPTPTARAVPTLLRSPRAWLWEIRPWKRSEAPRPI